LVPNAEKLPPVPVFAAVPNKPPVVGVGVGCCDPKRPAGLAWVPNRPPVVPVEPPKAPEVAVLAPKAGADVAVVPNKPPVVPPPKAPPVLVPPKLLAPNAPTPPWLLPNCRPCW